MGRDGHGRSCLPKHQSTPVYVLGSRPFAPQHAQVVVHAAGLDQLALGGVPQRVVGLGGLERVVVEGDHRAGRSFRRAANMGGHDERGGVVGDEQRRAFAERRHDAPRLVPRTRQEEHVRRAPRAIPRGLFARALQHERVEAVAGVGIIDAQRLVDHERKFARVRLRDGVGERRVVRRAAMDLGPVDDEVAAMPRAPRRDQPFAGIGVEARGQEAHPALAITSRIRRDTGPSSNPRRRWLHSRRGTGSRSPPRTADRPERSPGCSR
jgi:hypothetical protein